MERRLSAILAADVVGFASHNERDEAGTFERLRTHRKELFEPEIARHHGRIFKLMGDGLLAEFGSVVEAVECAVGLQRGMTERNDGVPADERIDVRVGINLGDVIIEGEDRHGEGVVIASRLQQLAKPGGIVVSGTVMEHVRRKLALHFEALGEHQVKNIDAPVAVHRVQFGAVIPTATPSSPRYRTWAIIGALAVLLTAGAGAAWYFSERNSPTARSEAAVVPAGLPGDPSRQQQDQGIPVIVVLPFQDLSGGKIEGDLGRGIAEEFLGDLATFPELVIVSSTSSFAYAGRPVPEIVKATGAQFVIEGSIRVAGDTALIRVQLINGTTDRHLQIAQIEQPMTEPVALQMEAARRLSEELGGMTGILRQEIERISWTRLDSELTEYDFYVRGHSYQRNGERIKAREIWAEGLKRFPDSVLMRCKLAFTYREGSEEAAKFVREIARLRKRSPLDEWYSHWVTAWNHSSQNDHNAASAEAKATVAMAPFDTLSHADLASILTAAGDHETAIAWAAFAATHDPRPRPWYFDNLADAYDMADRWPDALELAEEQLSKPSPNRNWYFLLARAYGGTNQADKADAAMAKYRSLPD